MVRMIALAGASAAVLATTASAFTVTITNACSGDIELYTRLASVYTDESETIASGGSVDKTIEKGYEGHFRNGSSDAATLIEFATMGDLDLAWYDLGIIPPRLDPGYEYCPSLQECMEHSDSGIGFNTAVQVTPQSNTGKDTCESIECLQNGCEDAYNYPKDDTKTHSCAFGTNFVVTFCPSGDASSNTQQQQTSSGSTTQEETTAPETTAPATTAPVIEAPATTAPVIEAPATTSPVIEAPATTAPVIEAPATTAPVTEAPATEAPVQEASAASDSGAGKVHTQGSSVNGESETTAPEVIQVETPAPTTVSPINEAPEVTPAATPTAAKSKYCV